MGKGSEHIYYSKGLLPLFFSLALLTFTLCIFIIEIHRGTDRFELVFMFLWPESYCKDQRRSKRRLHYCIPLR